MTHTLKATARVLALVAMLSFIAIAPASAVTSSTYRTQVIESTNSYRVDKGLTPVKKQACLDRWATGQAKWMAANNTLQHRSGRLMKILRSCGLRGASENIASRFPSGTKVVRAWSKSPAHAANMSAPKSRLVGVSAVRAKNGVWYVSQVFGNR